MPILRIFGGEIVFDYEVISCFDIQQATFQSQISLRIIAKLLENRLSAGYVSARLGDIVSSQLAFDANGVFFLAV